MKSLFAFVAIIIGSSSAFATHPYFTHSCTAKTMHGPDVNIYNLNNRNILAVSLSDDKVSVEDRLATFDGKKTEDNETLVLKTTSDKIVEKTKEKEDEDWSFEGTISFRTATVVSVSDTIAKALDLKVGQKLIFLCNDSVEYPTGN